MPAKRQLTKLYQTVSYYYTTGCLDLLWIRPVTQPTKSSTADRSARQRWMSVLAKAAPADLEARWQSFGEAPSWACLRPPETGMVMVRGRAGGTGQRFNLGEMTVTRCAVALDGGATGFGYVAGRDRRHAELAAVVDALMQDPARRQIVEQRIIEPLLNQQQAVRRAAARKTAATKVDFLTLVRGD